jgi:uncharacterized membrane protein
MDTLTSDAAAITAVIGYTSLIQARLPEEWRRYGVFVACAVGVAYAVSIRPGGQSLAETISRGVMTGLSASGGYAGMRHLRSTGG